MASNLILLKRSGTTGVIPTAAALQVGEIALNTADGRVWFKKTDGTIVEIITTLSGNASNSMLIVEGVIDVGASLPYPTAGKAFLCTKGQTAGCQVTPVSGTDFSSQVTALNNLSFNTAVPIYLQRMGNVDFYSFNLSYNTNFSIIKSATYQPWPAQTNVNIPYSYGGSSMQEVGGYWTRQNAATINIGSIVKIQYVAATYTEGKIYIGNGSSFAEAVLKDGQPISFAYDMTMFTGGKVMKQSSIYLWDTTLGFMDNNDNLATATDIEITDFNKGVILRASDASRWRLTITPSGVLVPTKM